MARPAAAGSAGVVRSCPSIRATPKTNLGLPVSQSLLIFRRPPKLTTLDLQTSGRSQALLHSEGWHALTVAKGTFATGGDLAVPMGSRRAYCPFVPTRWSLLGARG
jgi:hypothetical protein